MVAIHDSLRPAVHRQGLQRIEREPDQAARGPNRSQGLVLPLRAWPRPARPAQPPEKIVLGSRDLSRGEPQPATGPSTARGSAGASRGEHVWTKTWAKMKIRKETKMKT